MRVFLLSKWALNDEQNILDNKSTRHIEQYRQHQRGRDRGKEEFKIEQPENSTDSARGWVREEEEFKLHRLIIERAREEEEYQIEQNKETKRKQKKKKINRAVQTASKDEGKRRLI